MEQGAACHRTLSVRCWAAPVREWPAEPDRLGDNDGMASDDSKAPALLRLTLLILEGGQALGNTLMGVPVAPVVTQAAVGAGHWVPAAGRGPGRVGRRCWLRAGGGGLGAEARRPGPKRALAADSWRRPFSCASATS